MSANTSNQIALNRTADQYRPGNLDVVNKKLETFVSRVPITELLVGRL